jgi:preprotein translocase subunit SecA
MYGERMKVLRGEDVHEQVLKYIPDYVAEIVSSAVNVDAIPELWNEGELNQALELKVLPEGTNYVTRERLMKWDYELALKKISKRVEKEYEKKIADLKELGVDFSVIERRVLLSTVDRNWIDHIDAMDQLRKGIGLRAYGQVDPVISYKKEGFDMFDEMVERIQRTTISVLLKVRIEIRQPEPPVRVVNNPAPNANGENPATKTAVNTANASGMQAARKPIRRQMPSPLSSMSSQKPAQTGNEEKKD